MQRKGEEGGCMSVMVVNRKGWTAWCMDITYAWASEESRRRGGVTALHSLTKDADFLALPRPFSITHQAGKRLKRMGGLKQRGLQYIPSTLKYACV